LRPISPSPPRKAIRVVPGAAGGSSLLNLGHAESNGVEQAPGELDLVGGGVDQGRAQRPGRQAEQVHARLEQDRAGGGEQALEQLQVAQVEVEGGTGVAALEGLDELLESRADQVGGHADHPAPPTASSGRRFLSSPEYCSSRPPVSRCRRLAAAMSPTASLTATTLSRSSNSRSMVGTSIVQAVRPGML
jgi:hypothetical protein